LQKADIVIYGKNIFDGTQQRVFDGAIGIAGKRIIFVGDREKVAPFLKEETLILNYNEQFVMPGFIDSHTHVQHTIMHFEGVYVGGCASMKEAAEKIHTYYIENPKKKWILAYGWLMADWKTNEFPTKELLNWAVPDKPVIATQAEEHGMWLNSKAMEAVGIDRNFMGIQEGYTKIDAEGNPTGCIFESSMRPIVEKFFLLPTKKSKEMLDKFSEYASTNGITTVTDMRPLFGVDLGSDEAYESYAKKEIGIRYCTTVQLGAKNCNKVLKLKERWKEYDFLYCVGFKDFMDGVASAYTAFLSEPYCDNPTACGAPFMTKEELEEKVLEAHKQDISVHIHCIGDEAVHWVLDAYEKANLTYGRQHQRHTIEHIEVLKDEDVSRFVKYDITASVQPQHLVLMSHTDEGETYRNYFGSQRDHMLFRNKDIINTGANVAFGTDAPIVDINPLPGIYRAMTRVHDDGLPENGWNPSQKLTVYEALKAYTYGSAYSMGLEDRIGQLKEGYLADITIIDTNLAQASSEQIRDAHINMTMVNGKIIYKK
jgi:predicted amidohydrolase YtcJ